MKLFWKTNRDGVADTVAQRAAEAAAIASVSGQELLDSPWANPALRPHAERLRDDQQRQALNASHSRSSRRIRVTDRRAARAEQALEILADARETTSPARSVLELHHGRQRFMRIALAASLTLSVGAALGLNKLATDLNAPTGTGFIAEIGLTCLSTAAILYRSHLSQYGKADFEGWQSKVLIALMIVPLLISCVGNAVAAGLVGISCSVGAAAFSLLSYVVAETSADALEHQAKKIREEDEAELRQVAVDGDLFTVVREPTPETSLEPAPEPRALPVRHAICLGPDGEEGTVFLRRPLPKPRPSTRSADQVHRPVTEVREPAALEISEPQTYESTETVREPAASVIHEPQADASMEQAHELDVRGQAVEFVEAVREPDAPEIREQRSSTNSAEQGDVAALSPRARRKQEELRAVLGLFDELGGPDKVDMGTIQRRLGFKRSNAHNRRQQAIPLWRTSSATTSTELTDSTNRVRRSADEATGS